MSKRLIEFNCGDPKSNQQTASKVDCQITINNSQVSNERDEKDGKDGKDGKGKYKKQTKRDIRIIDGVEVFEFEEVSDIETALTEDKLEVGASTNSTEEFNSRVVVPIKTKHRSTPPSTERFVMVSKQPIVTAEEIENNIEFHRRHSEILTHTLCMDDKKLLANLIDTTGKVIISAQDLCELIALVLSDDEFTIRPSDVNLTLQEEYISTCLKVQVSPFKKIISIKINKQDFHNVQNEAYNALTDIYKISMDTVYVIPLSKP
jgi:hypothetical protein